MDDKTSDKMVWGIKNGDLDQVKDIIENKVSAFCLSFANKYNLILILSFTKLLLLCLMFCSDQ